MKAGSKDYSHGAKKKRKGIHYHCKYDAQCSLCIQSLLSIQSVDVSKGSVPSWNRTTRISPTKALEL
jgi:hypothetical protein